MALPDMRAPPILADIAIGCEVEIFEQGVEEGGRALAR